MLHKLFRIWTHARKDKTCRKKTKYNVHTMCIQSTGLVQVLGGNKTIYTSEQANICTFYYSGTIIVIKKWKINICFFSSFLPEWEENERMRRIRNKPFILSGLITRQHVLSISVGTICWCLCTLVKASWSGPRSYPSVQNHTSSSCLITRHPVLSISVGTICWCMCTLVEAPWSGPRSYPSVQNHTSSACLRDYV